MSTSKALQFLSTVDMINPDDIFVTGILPIKMTPSLKSK
jgi:hypothetical protein